MRAFRLKLCVCLTLATVVTGQYVCAGTDSASPGAAAKQEPKAVHLSGKVLETMNGGGYTYVLLKNGAEKVWVAIPITKVTVGQELTLQPGYEFRNFNSKALNRKFDRVIFSAGVEGNQIQLPPSAIKMAHEGVPMNGQQSPAATRPAPAPSPAAPTKAASAGPAKQAPPAAPVASTGSPKSMPLMMQRIPKAKGPNAYTIAQLYANRTKLEKKPVVVRGKVVKVSTRILKRNWVHLQDGTGTVKKKNNFVVVTTKDLPKEGDVVTAKGLLYNRIDLGMGYKFEIIIQDAKVK